MCNKITFAIALISCIFLTACAANRQILNLPNQTTPYHVSESQIKTCIESAAASRAWQTREIKAGLIRASINSRSHYAEVSIPYSKKGYSIMYYNSRNLQAKSDGTIHRNYNKWIALLSAGIQKCLASQ